MVAEDEIERLFEHDQALTQRQNQKISDGTANTQVAQRFKELLQKAVSAGVSDVHIEIYSDKVEYWQRVDGRRLPLSGTQPNRADGLAICSYLFNVRGTMTDSGFVETKVNNCRLELPLMSGGQLQITEWRASYCPASSGGALVLRWTNQAKTVPTWNELGLDAEHQKKLRRFLASPSGVMIITGKTGSGKSTTIAASICQIDKSRNVRTIENPVEIEVGVIQSNAATPEEFAEISKTLLRHDVDVEIHGEVRTGDAAMELCRKGETGQLVMTTLHTSSAIGIAHTLAAQFNVPAAVVAAPNLMKIWLYQTLVRKLCPHCHISTDEAATQYADKEAFEDYEQAIEALKASGKPTDEVRWRNLGGCEHCHQGEKGRIVVLELLELNDIDRDFIIRGDYLNWQRSLRERGFETVREHALRRVLAGEIDILSAATKVDGILEVPVG
ncbi:MAG: ATPase, T2SS/T4P/T4SS family [Ferrimonas sp.]